MTNHPSRNRLEAPRLPNGAYQPLLAEANRIADAAKIKVDVWSGPIGGHGFRTGWWPVERDGEQAMVYASVSHAAEIEAQRRTVAAAAAQAFAIRDLRRAGYPEEK